eukprot:scaffold6136_cov56-Phaeocystis_antarctica.AAC.4
MLAAETSAAGLCCSACASRKEWRACTSPDGTGTPVLRSEEGGGRVPRGGWWVEVAQGRVAHGVVYVVGGTAGGTRGAWRGVPWRSRPACWQRVPP